MSNNVPMKESVKMSNELFVILRDRAVMNEEEAGAISYALGDISSSVETIYSSLVPMLLKDANLTRSKILDILWDIRSEFRHIQYHIDDAKLAEWEI